MAGGAGAVTQLAGLGDRWNDPDRDCHWVGVPGVGCARCPSAAFVKLSKPRACVNDQSNTP